MERPATILLVDDEVDFRRDLQATLQARGYEVVPAASRSQAEEIVVHRRPDMAIIGTLTPRGDAFRLHQWLKRSPNLSDVPLVVIDAPMEQQLLRGWRRDEGMQLGAEEFYCKPIHPAALLTPVAKCLDRATRKIKVLVVDDHAVVREGIRVLLSLQTDILVVGEATDGREAVEKTLELRPDVVLMDVVMPGMNGLEATRQISRTGRPARVLILTQYDDEENKLASAQVGAFGFIPKKSASSQLLAGIRSASLN